MKVEKFLPFLYTQIYIKMKIFRLKFSKKSFVVIFLALFAYSFSFKSLVFGLDDSNLALSGVELIDADGDKLTDFDEINIYNTDFHNPDTDGDGFDDYTEVYNGYSPRHAEPKKLSTLDSNNDKLPDSWKIRLGLNILKNDSDSDGYDDYTEIINGYNPNSSDKTKVDKLIKVNLAQQSLAYYFGTVELEKFLISSGVSSMPTPKGDFKVLDKVPSKNYGGTGYNFYYPNTKWNLHFTTARYRYYIHGAYWHNNFGKPMSHGCINVNYLNMEKLYNFAEVGTRIDIN